MKNFINKITRFKRVIIMIVTLFAITMPLSCADIKTDIAYLNAKGWLPEEFIDATNNQQPVTRAMLTSIIVRAFNIDKRKALADISTDFNDVSTSHWAYDEIVQAVKHQVLSGYQMGYFHPDHPITKAEGLTILSQGYGVVKHGSADSRETLNRICDANKLPLWSHTAIVSGIQTGFIKLDHSEVGCTFLYPNESIAAQDVLSVLIPYAQRQDEPSPAKGL